MTTPPEGQGPQRPGTPEDAAAGEPISGSAEVSGADNTPPGGVQRGEVEAAGSEGPDGAGNGGWASVGGTSVGGYRCRRYRYRGNG